MTSPLPDDLALRLSYLIEGDKEYSALKLTLDLEGYDTTDEAFVTAAIRQARGHLQDRRYVHSALATFSAHMLAHPAIGERIGMPRSTVQSFACGRLPERYTPAQKAAFKALLHETIAGMQEALALLG